MTSTRLGSLLGCFVVATAALAGSPAQAEDQKIYTGGKTGSYYTSFGPLLQAYLKKGFFNYEVVTSAGSGENIDKVLQDPAAIGLVQSDVLAFRAAQEPGILEKIVIVRNDVGNECLFAVTSAANIDRLGNWGDVQSFGRRLRFATGPEASGGAVTFAYLQKLNERLAASTPAHLESVDKAIEAVVGGSADVAFFVQFADPNNPRFEAINKAKLAFIPVVDRSMLRERINDQKVYVAQDVKVTGANILSWRGVQRITTACTPIAYITGNPANIAAGNARVDQEDRIEAIRKADVSELRPKENWFAAIKDSVAEASGQGLESLLSSVEQAAQQIRQ